MTLAAAFTTAWKDLKKTALAAAAFVAKNGPTIQAEIKTGETVLAQADPAAAPIVTAFDGVEEQIAGAVMAVASDATKSAALEQLFADAWPTIQTLTAQLRNHPAVQATQTK